MYYCPQLDKSSIYSRPICNISQEICVLCRYCSLEHHYYNTEYAVDCKLLKEKNMKNYRFIKNNLIYIDVLYMGETITVTVPNIYGENIPDTIDVVEYKGNFYIKGYEPKEVVKKSNKKGCDKDEE